MPSRTAQILYVGDASSIVRASAEAKVALDSVNSSASDHSKTLGKSVSLVGGLSSKMKLLTGVAATLGPALAGSTAAAIGTGVALAGLTASVGTLVAGFDALKATHSGFTKQVKATQGEFQKMMGQAAEPLLKPFEQAMKQAGKLEPALHSLFAGAAKMVQPLASGIITIAKTALPQVGNVLKASSGLIKPLADSFASLIKTLGPIFTQTIKAMQPIIGPVIKGIGGAIAGLMSGINVMLKAMGPALKPLSQVFTALGKIVGSLFAELAPGLKASTSILGSLVSVVAPLGVALAKIADTLSTALAPTFNQLAKIIANLIPQMMPFVKVILTSLGNVLTEIAPLLAKVVTTLMRDLAPLLPQLVKLFSQLVTIGLQTLTKALVQLLPVMVKLINAVLPPLLPALKALMPLVTGAARLLGSVLVEAVKLLVPVLKLAVDAIGWVVRAISGIDQKAEPAMKAVIGTMSSAWDSVRNTTVNVWDGIKRWLSGAWDDITNTISTFGSDVENGVVSVFDGAANSVIGFVDDIIKAINLIPGVPNIKTISPIGSSGSGGPKAPAGAGGYAVGGKVDRPMFMVGEEAPRHPEFVLATNPAYRHRNMGLWAQAGHELGIPGFATGGIVGWAKSAAQTVSGAVSGLFSKGAGAITGLLPGVGSLPSWIRGMGSTVLGDVTNWIKSKVSSIVKSIGSALGFGGGHGHPIAGGAGAMSQSAIESVWTAAGGPPSIAHLMAAIADAESSGIPSNIQQGQPYATTGWGLWQITPGNSEPQYGINQALLNPLNNARAAVAKYRSGGLGQWTTYTSGAYKQFYAKGGIPGMLGSETSAISRGMAALNSLMGPRGTYNKYGEDLSYYPSLWQISNTLLGSGASSFINTTNALGNPIAPTINTKALGLTLGEEGQELGWYSAQIANIRQAVPIAKALVPMIHAAIAEIKRQIQAIKRQIQENLRKIRALNAQIQKATHGQKPYPNARTKAQRAANAAAAASSHIAIYGKDGNGGWRGEISSLEAQNNALGGTQTTVGTGGQIGALQKRITRLQNDLSQVTGSGSYSPLTLTGATGLGGMLGPDLLQQKTLQAQLASISGANIQAALSAAQGSYTASNPAISALPTFTGPTTTQELTSLLNGMPGLARAQGGPVLPGYVYRVGEKGPEDVVFGQPGHVMTAAQTRGGSGSGNIINNGVINMTGATAAKAAVDRLAYRAAIGVA